ncbi:hypothetical protein RND81_14G017600 [Saponaria officinalis]|uniref:Uncharacterized protein n=1 Tax=Saponaria officinalis TaxID=3572 RepID=A0AAW1GKP6_SAPOF
MIEHTINSYTITRPKCSIIITKYHSKITKSASNKKTDFTSTKSNLQNHKKFINTTIKHSTITKKNHKTNHQNIKTHKSQCRYKRARKKLPQKITKKFRTFSIP